MPYRLLEIATRRNTDEGTRSSSQSKIATIIAVREHGQEKPITNRVIGDTKLISQKGKMPNRLISRVQQSSHMGSSLPNRT